MKSGIPGGALVLVGLLVVGLGLFAARSILMMSLGIMCLVAAGLLEVIALRR